MNQKIRVRFAPSPTGSLHLGGARTALYNYAFARHYDGKFILRVEDTDTERSSEDSQRQQLEELRWLGLEWDEGPDIGGEFAPYKQSLRTEYYHRIVKQLFDKGLAYYCFLSDAEIERLREQSRQWQSPYRSLDAKSALARVERGDAYTVRFKLPDEVVRFDVADLVRGDVSLSTEGLTDFVLLRAGGMPVYNFCCVCDDHMMQISHVFRGEEHLPNTLKQLILYHALGWDAPKFGHLSVIVNADRKKLSKRDGAVSVGSFREEGYLAEGILNGIALLGWSHPEAKEIFSLADLIKHFDGKRLGAASAFFDREKMAWTNQEHIKTMDPSNLWRLLQPYVNHLELPSDKDWPMELLKVYQTELVTLSDAADLFEPFSKSHFKICDTVMPIFDWEKTAQLLEAWLECLKTNDSDDFFAEFIARMSKDGIKGKFLFMPLRAAIIGKLQGAEMKSLVTLLPKQELTRRCNLLIEAHNEVS